MKLLAVETSSMACSVALQVGENTVERHLVEAKSHTHVLLPMITELLDEASIRPADLDALVLGNGPGSFIGMRIGASVVQGLAFASGLNIVPVSSLAAVAAEAMSQDPAKLIVVAQDARMNEIYLGGFRRSVSGIPEPFGDETIHPVGQIEFLEENGLSWLAAGAAWQRYPELLARNDAALTGVMELSVPRARFLLGIANEMIEKGAEIPPDRLTPAYLRNRVATPPKV